MCVKTAKGIGCYILIKLYSRHLTLDDNDLMYFCKGMKNIISMQYLEENIQAKLRIN